MAEKLIAQREPYPVTVEAGKKYWWCACGRSAQQPFCDGSHKGTGISPIAFTPTAAETLYFCGCKHSAEQPFCDGTHAHL